MTKTEAVQMVRSMGLPFAYDHFAEGESPEPPFVVYLYPESDNFAADGVVYYEKDMELEQRIEGIFDGQGLFYNKSEVWIPSERLYEVLYQMEV